MDLRFVTDVVIANMRERAARCRRLAEGILNPRDAATLRKMANEIEADIKRLEQHKPEMRRAMSKADIGRRRNSPGNRAASEPL